MVSDPDVEIARAYGVRQKDRDLAVPSTFVVGRDGRIRFARVARHPLDRPTVDEILAALRR